jgi:hypothetical protein
MIRVFWANQKMKVHEARLRRHIEPHLDVREDEPNVGKAPGNMLPKHLFVGVGDVIVCDGNGLDLRRKSLKRSEVIPPRIAATELVVQNSSGRMNVRLPAPPLRSTTDHCHFLAVTNAPPVDITYVIE